MNRNKLADAIAWSADLTKSEANRAVNALFETIAETLASGESVKIMGFGTFCTHQRKESTGRDPRNGEPIVIPAMVIPKFKPGRELKKRVSEEKK